MSDKHLNEKELSDYLAAMVPNTERGRVERHLKLCSSCFQTYMNMREAIFLQKSGEKISTKLRDALLQKIRDTKQSHISIIIRSLKDKIIVFSGDQDSLSYQGLKASYAFRDGKDNLLSRSEEGPISITRTIEEREVTLTVHPLAQREKIGLSLTVKPSDKLKAVILFNGEECEAIEDITHQSMLSTQLPRQGELDIYFSKNGETLFTIALTLEGGEH